MELIVILEVFQEQIARVEVNRDRRYLRDTSNPLMIPNKNFKELFRINKDIGNWLLMEIGPYMQDGTRVTHIPKAIRLFAAIQFMAQGSYQKAVGQDFYLPMSQSSISRCISEVTDLIVEHLGYLIKFPESQQEKNQEKQRFMQMEHGFPGIIGCIDCTQIAIIAPPTNDPEQPGIIFYCRKQYYSLNVQIICNAELKILNINARFPGSAHDSAIWQTSTVLGHLRDTYINDHTYLLGDSGYPLQPWLLTPVLRPQTVRERMYNAAHISVRNVVERCNGVLKQRFRCTFKHRVLNYDPYRAAHIIYSCAILHNLCVSMNDQLEDYDENLNNMNNYDPDPAEDHEPLGRHVRNEVIENYFALED